MFLTDVEAESLSYEASLPVGADSQFPRVSSCCLACLPGHHKTCREGLSCAVPPSPHDDNPKCCCRHPLKTSSPVFQLTPAAGTS